MFNNFYNQYNPTDQDIRPFAYLLWERAGNPEGRDIEFWLKGRELVIRRHRLKTKESRLDA